MKVVERFVAELPALLEGLRESIDAAVRTRAELGEAFAAFVATHPAISPAQLRELLIQHVATGPVFDAVFEGLDAPRDGLTAELDRLAGLLELSPPMRPRHEALAQAARSLESPRARQAFLDALYGGYYRVNDRKAADKLGMIYTPQAIVEFMLDGAAWLCERHFCMHLADAGVEIIDPATGTGTFVCELLAWLHAQRPDQLATKYRSEIIAHEVASLPHQIAQRNIAASYAALTGDAASFPGLRLVDTLEVEPSAEPGRIVVVLGNPPYNANQPNANDNNENRSYASVDERIKATYVANSTAQKSKVYDMYARFFRWASDRIGDNGVIAFVVNRSFIDSRTFDGFRKVVAAEFCEIHIVDLGGDVYQNPALSGTKHNVFGIQTGVAIGFWVKRAGVRGSTILLARRPELETAAEKLRFLARARISEIEFEPVAPDSRANWISAAVDDEFAAFLPIVDKPTKQARDEQDERAIFKLFSLGAVSNRDDWVYDHDITNLERKIVAFIDIYEAERARWGVAAESASDAQVDRCIKWTSELEAHLRRGTPLAFRRSALRRAMYRPYVARWTYYDRLLTHRIYQHGAIFPFDSDAPNRCIVLTDPTAQKPWMVCAVDRLPDLHFVGAAAGAVCLPFERVEGEQRRENITDWALAQFRSHYARTSDEREISKRAIFHYVYAVLHDPIYRERHAQSLAREYPRVPLQPDFWRWSDWGEALLDLHVGYEATPPYPLQRNDAPVAKARSSADSAILRADKLAGVIVVDEKTSLAGVPALAWEYRLGHRSALEWVLDQYKERAPKDPTVRERFSAYRFADFKEQVIELLGRVTAVSVRTQTIVAAMRATAR